MQLHEAIYHLQPVAEFKINGQAEYANVEWLNPAIPMPTGEEVAAAMLIPSLREVRGEMAAILDALPTAVHAGLYVTRKAVEMAFDEGRVDIARHLVEAQAVPAELESTKAEILALFPL